MVHMNQKQKPAPYVGETMYEETKYVRLGGF